MNRTCRVQLKRVCCLAALATGVPPWSGRSCRLAAQEKVETASVQVTSTSAYPPGTILGVVNDAESGQGLDGAQVHIQGTSVGVLTDSLGRFTLGQVVPGPSRLEIVLIGYVEIYEDIVVEEDRALVVMASMSRQRSRDCGLVACAGPFGCYAFEVEVRDIGTGMAPEALVTLRVSGQEASDSMSLRASPGEEYLHLGAGADLDKGPYEIAVTAPGYTAWRQSGVTRGDCGFVDGNPRRVWLVRSGRVQTRRLFR